MALTLGFGESGLSGIVRRSRRHERIMPKSQQVAKIKQILVNKGINVRVGDVEDLVDSTVSYEDNKREILRHYGVMERHPGERQLHEMQCTHFSNACRLDGEEVCEIACKECDDKRACKILNEIRASGGKSAGERLLAEWEEEERKEKKKWKKPSVVKKPIAKKKVKVKKIIKKSIVKVKKQLPKSIVQSKTLTDNQIQHIRKYGYVNVTIEGVKKRVTKRNYAPRSKTVNWYKSGGKVCLKVVRR